MACGDLGLQRAGAAAQRLGTVEGLETTANEEPVPPSAVLVSEEYWLSGGVGARRRGGRRAAP